MLSRASHRLRPRFTASLIRSDSVSGIFCSTFLNCVTSVRRWWPTKPQLS